MSHSTFDILKLRVWHHQDKVMDYWAWCPEMEAHYTDYLPLPRMWMLPVFMMIMQDLSATVQNILYTISAQKATQDERRTRTRYRVIWERAITCLLSMLPFKLKEVKSGKILILFVEQVLLEEKYYQDKDLRHRSSNRKENFKKWEHRKWERIFQE